ncbi:MAG: PA2778 family cysteine peptidase [Burkholderiaceae bacterium]|jgi:tetratricopeptide (TPR) repeat protein|nr:PA2778 family cysteine peptidase [Burkholderiaceae bacterium]MEB2319254.1 PA2778 family cysteine peptidase [Pseudomonadota bacterium]
MCRPTGQVALALVFAVTLLAGCASQTRALLAAPPAGLPQRVDLEHTPYFEQADYQCGPASLSMALGAAGIETRPEDLIGEVFVPERQGSLQIEMIAAARSRGAVAVRIPTGLDALLAELAAGHPVVVLQNLSLPISPIWHYAVAIGYDLGREELLLRSGPMRRQQLALSTFEHTWARSGYWAFVALEPGRLPATATEAEVTAALVAFERGAPPGEARRAYASALARWPGSKVLAIGLGNAAYAAGDRATAAEVFRAAALRHDDDAAWHNLAVVLRESGRLEEAEQAASRAVEADGPWSAQARAELDRVRSLRAQPPATPLKETPGRPKFP